jgi:hypothetical protein
LAGEKWSTTSNSVSYNVFPDIFVTIKRANKISFSFAGNLFKSPLPEQNQTRYVQVSLGTMDRKKPIVWSDGSLKLTRRDYSDTTVGSEIYTDWDLALNVGDKTIGGSIKSHSIFNNVDSTCQDYVDIQISGMKIYKFDHEFVTFAAVPAEAKGCVSYLKYWNWYMHYEGFDTLAYCGMSIYR